MPHLFRTIRRYEQGVVGYHPSSYFYDPHTRRVLKNTITRGNVSKISRSEFTHANLTNGSVRTLLGVRINLLSSYGVFGLRATRRIHSLLPLFLPSMVPGLNTGNLYIPL